MPRLDGVEEKYFNGYRIDKENATTVYSDEKHIYLDKSDSKPFTSVTTLIHSYTQEFDEEFWSAYKALEQIMDPEIFGIIKPQLLETKKLNPRLLGKLQVNQEEFETKQQEIKDEYARKRNESCERGTAIHAMFENSFYNRNKFDFSKYGYKDLVGDFNCTKNYYELDMDKAVYPEFLISLTSPDGILKIAGQIDLLVKDGNDIWIIDWKTNKEIKKTSYYNKKTKSNEMMKFPLNNIMDCNFWHYTLQLSTYAYLLQQINPEFNIKGLKLVHIDHEGIQHEYDCEYAKDAVERMLKHYKKTLKVKEALDRNKPINII